MDEQSGSVLGRITIALLLLCVVGTGLFLIALNAGWFESGYFGFLKHDKSYYAEIARGCDHLLAQAGKVSGERTFQGDDEALPASLRNLHATTIRVANRIKPVDGPESSYVSIIFGGGRPDFVVTWGAFDDRNPRGRWELTDNGDGPHAVVYSVEPHGP